MASKKTIEIVKATAPVLKEHGEAITKVMYKNLFEKHPELKDTFNMSHQKKGTQQKVLATTVFQYAVHIDKLEMLGDTVEAIAQKHVSLSITKEAYPIVGKLLLAAIKEVLGDAATDEIINAWAEAYGDLAAIFVSREEAIYTEKEDSEGGYRGTKEFIVVKKEKESDVVTSFYLKRKDDTVVPKFVAGQYIAISIDIPGANHKHTRNYSLSDSSDKDYLRVSVKKEIGNPNGKVSNFLHSNLQVDSVLNIGIPSGSFVLKESNAPIVFISGGIGVTPLLSMFKEAKKNINQQIVFIQCDENSNTQAFNKELLSNSSNIKVVKVFNNPMTKDVKSDNYEGYLTKDILKDLNISNSSQFYFCGPTPFMKLTLAILKDLKVSEENINFEFFGPKEELV